MSDKFPPSIDIARLYERLSSKGNLYLAGRLGGAKVVILKTNDTDQDGHPIWQMKLSQAPAAKAGDPANRAEPSAVREPRGFGSQVDNEIPF